MRNENTNPQAPADVQPGALVRQSPKGRVWVVEWSSEYGVRLTNLGTDRNGLADRRGVSGRWVNGTQEISELIPATVAELPFGIMAERVADFREKVGYVDPEIDALADAYEAEKAERKATRAANLAAITEEFRTVEVMTDAGTVYATAGHAEENADGTTSQEITVTGGRVIGHVTRSARDEFKALSATRGEIQTALNQRSAIAAVVLYDEVLTAAQPADVAAEAAELAETRDAAHGLITATAKRAAARIRQDRAETAAERSASRAAMAATLAHQAAAEALDAGSEATRLALLVKPGADAAEVEDAAGAAIAAADAAARSAGQAKAAAELAAAYAAEALEIAQYAPEAPEDVQAPTDTPEAPEAVSEAQGADQADIWPSEAIDQGRATETRWTAGQRVRFDYVGQPEPAFGTVEADTEMGASNVPVRMDSGSRVLVAWNGPQAV